MAYVRHICRISSGHFCTSTDISTHMKTIIITAVLTVFFATSLYSGHSRGNGTCADDKVHYQNMYKKRTDAPLWNESVAMRDKANSMNNTEKCEEYYEEACLLYTSPSPRDYAASRMPSSA